MKTLQVYIGLTKGNVHRSCGVIAHQLFQNNERTDSKDKHIILCNNI